MKRGYGFGVSIAGETFECLFTEREWRILTDGSQFNRAGGLKKLIGLDAMGPQIGVAKYQTQIVRPTGYFLGQLSGIRLHAMSDSDVFAVDYSSVIRGSGQSPLVTTRFEYLGYSATVKGGPGHCTLSWHGVFNKKIHRLGYIDLRREKTFEIGHYRILSIRRKQRLWHFESPLEELKVFLEQFDPEERLTIILAGGDT